jgi:hypothetical protein
MASRCPGMSRARTAPETVPPGSRRGDRRAASERGEGQREAQSSSVGKFRDDLLETTACPPQFVPIFDRTGMNVFVYPVGRSRSLPGLPPWMLIGTVRSVAHFYLNW